MNIMVPKLTPVKIKNLINYWSATAQYDYKTMLSLFKSRRYANALFFSHIVLDKIFKAHVVKGIKKAAPYTHALVRLYKLSGLSLSEEEVDLLYQINDFNIRSRYPDFKYNFYKNCTKNYTQRYYELVKKLYQKLCRELKQKK